jgi:hypothetical protein
MHGTVVAVEQGDRFRLEVVLPLHPEEAFA